MGVAYKRDTDDLRESPALDVMHLLMKRGARITYSDPHAPEAAADCVVIITDHAAFDYGALLEQAQVIVDTRNALKGFTSGMIIRL